MFLLNLEVLGKSTLASHKAISNQIFSNSPDKIKGESPEANPLRLRLSQGAITRDQDAGVPGTRPMPPAPLRRGEGQRPSLQGRPRQGH